MALLRAIRRRSATGDRQPSPRLRLALCALLISVALDASAQTGPPREYQLKAVFLFNFAQFVEWPTTAFAEAQTPLVIGVLGADPFDSYLDETVRGERVNNRTLSVRRYQRVEQIQDCQVLFISRSEAGRLKEVLSGLRGRPILTVGESENFAKEGGMVRFVTEKNRIRLRINLEAAKAVNLTISSKLLRPAEIVAPGRN